MIINEISTKPDRVNLSSWREYILCESSKLDCKVCLGDGGQSFTWESLDEVTWYNVIDGFCVVIRDDSAVDSLVKLYVPPDQGQDSDAAFERVKDYLRLNEDLEELCREWSRSDTKFPQTLVGIRLLRQDPLETLFAFICSQNNLISRIKQLVRTLKREFGALMGEFIFDGGLSIQFYAFPKDASVFRSHEAQLREWKFGYRAKYISSAAMFLCKEKMATSLDLVSFRDKSYEESVVFLKRIPGIGPKVADCVALMSLDQLGSVPIDTHIWRIARERYKFTSTLKIATLNDRLYREIGDKFRQLFGVKAGWAHSVLFTAELRNKTNKKKPKQQKQL
jgi:N-glycosylase/DNA lyase